MAFQAQHMHPLAPFLALLIVCAPALRAAEFRVPPAGITLTTEQHTSLKEGTAALRGEIDAMDIELKAQPALHALLTDVEIFHKAVDWALRYDEFFEPGQIEQAHEQLRLGRERIAELRAGKPNWIYADGLVVRGYRSRIDDSIQPYGLVVPGGWSAAQPTRRPLWLWQHGRGEKLSELAFLNDRLKNPGDLVPEGAIVLHLYGRFCNANKFAGETDLFEALADVQKRYPIDPERLVVTGFSMGGAACWQFATHYAGRWAAASPGAGFAETAEFANVFEPGKTPPPWWEQTLWRWYDATGYAANLANCPVIAYAGETDKQRQAPEIMEKALAVEGLKLDWLIGPQTGHKYHPETKTELVRRMEKLTALGREAMPPKVRLTIWTLRYPTMEWVTVDAMEKHWERARVDAELVDEGTIRVKTQNVSAFTIALPVAPVPLDKTHPPRILIDDTDLTGPPVSDFWTAHFRKIPSGSWALAPTARATQLEKRHGLTGPIDDAFLDRFIFVKPTGKPLNSATGEWVNSELDRACLEWRTVFRGDARTVADSEITDAMIADSNLILWGDPSSNSLLARLLPQLPIQWTPDTITAGRAGYSAEHHAPVFIFPNPLNPERYVVINSSFTFRAGSAQSNALQTPKLPDWAIVDLRTKPNLEAPGGIVDAGFFDEQWRFPR